MKCITQLVLVFGLLASAVGVLAQPTLVSPVEVVEGSSANPDDDELATSWGVLNGTDDTLMLMVTRTVIEAVEPYNCPYNPAGEGAYDRFCWGPLCYDYCSTSSNNSPQFLVEILPGDTNTSFISDYYHQGIPGKTELKYCFQPLSGVKDGVCHTVAFCVDQEGECVVGTGQELEHKAELGLVFPQPVSGLSSLRFDLGRAVHGTLVIRDLMGKTLREVPLTTAEGVVFIQGEDYANGVYFCTLEAYGKTIATRRFSIAH